MTRAQPPTSRDVARVAGVSRSTVSAVLRDSPSNIRVSAATRERILAAAAALGYSPDPIAQALRRQRSQLIGFVTRPLRAGPHEQPIRYQIGVSIAEAARAAGHHVVHVDAEADDLLSGTTLVRFLLGQRVDGAILDAPGSTEEVALLRAAGLPLVQILRPQAVEGTGVVTVDAAPGIIAALDHLAVLGHRRIAFLGHGGAHPADATRREIFLQRLERHGLAATRAALHLVPDYTLASGYTATRALLGEEVPPTALFAASDGLALGALRACYEARIRIPHDLSLISYDDALAADLYPPLTSVAQPLREVGAAAVALLLAQVRGEPVSLAPHLLPTRLTIRASTAPPPDSARA